MNLLRAFALIAGLLSASYAMAAPRPLAPVPETLSHAENDVVLFPKTVIYAGVASLFDIGIGYVIGGGFAIGSVVAAVGSVSGWLLYHVHERLWTDAVPDAPVEATLLARTTTFSMANVVRLTGLGLLGTQGVFLSGTFLAVNALGDAAAYVVTDRVWTLSAAKAWMSRQQ